MDDGIKIFSTALSHLSQRDLKMALETMRPYAETHPYVLYTEELEAIEESFRLMIHYMEQGADDPLREKMYADMLVRTKKVVRNMRADYRRRKVDVFRDAFSRVGKQQSLSVRTIKTRLENFVTDVAMLQLESHETIEEKTKALYSDHYKFIESVFCDIVCSYIWTADYAAEMMDMLLKPTIDTSDAQILLSAIMLATMNNFDVNKFRLLVEVYRNSTNEHVRQRAFIGWALSMTDKTDSSEQTEILNRIIQDEESLNEMADLQIQIIFCMNAENDNAVIQRDIMPTLIRNSNLNISRLGITEKEEDTLQNILDPDAQDLAMEETEEKFRKMMDMQKTGVDIYFGGFSQMKRFPFFYSLVNWFCPFNINHPELSKSTTNLKSSKFLNNLFESGPFCDSDKYSFALAMSTIINSLPDNIKEMMGSSDALGNVMTAEDMESAEYIRRKTLQDLYRFFRLYRWHDQLYNPFTNENCLFLTSRLLSGEKTESKLANLGYFLLNRRMPELLRRIVERLDNVSNNQSLLLKGMYHLNYSGDSNAAYECFSEVINTDSDNEQALTGLAKSAFRSDRMETAEKIYAKLYEKNPDKKSLAIEYCIILDKAGKFEDAAKIMYRLDFQYPDNPNIKRVLAWTLLGQHKLAQAEKEYSWLMCHEKTAVMDILNAAYCKWFTKDIKGAAELLAQYCALNRPKGSSIDNVYIHIANILDKEFVNDKDMLKRYGITETDMVLMKSIVSETSKRNAQHNP